MSLFWSSLRNISQFKGFVDYSIILNMMLSSLWPGLVGRTPKRRGLRWRERWVTERTHSEVSPHNHPVAGKKYLLTFASSFTENVLSVSQMGAKFRDLFCIEGFKNNPLKVEKHLHQIHASWKTNPTVLETQTFYLSKFYYLDMFNGYTLFFIAQQ